MSLNPAGRLHPSTLPVQPSPAQPCLQAQRDGWWGPPPPAAGGPRGVEPARPAPRAAGRWGQCSAAEDQELHLVRRCSHAAVRGLILQRKPVSKNVRISRRFVRFGSVVFTQVQFWGTRVFLVHTYFVITLSPIDCRVKSCAYRYF